MMVVPFIPKDDPELPDYYGIKITYINGKTDSLSVVSHSVISAFKDGMVNQIPFLEYVTHDDLWGWSPLSSILKVEFDKTFSKMVAKKKMSNSETKK